jgi:hypothetical protein
MRNQRNQKKSKMESIDRNLSSDEIKAYRIFLGYKSFARKEELERAGFSFDEITERLIGKGLLKRNKAGSLLSVLSYQDGTALISSVRVSLEKLKDRERDLLMSLEEAKIAFKDACSTSLAFYERDPLEDEIAYLRRSLEEVRKTIALKTESNRKAS